MEFLGSNEEGMGVECLYKGVRAGRPRGGRQAPLSRLWVGPPGARGATGPPVVRGGGDRPLLHPRAPARDLFANLYKKEKITLTPHIGKAVRWALAAFSPYATSALGPGWAVPSRATDNFSLFDDEEWNKTCCESVSKNSWFYALAQELQESP